MMDDLYLELIRLARQYNLAVSLSDESRIARRVKDKDTIKEHRTRERRKSDRKRQNKRRNGVGVHHKRRDRADASLGTRDANDPDLTADKD